MLLEVKNVKMFYKLRKGWVRAVDDVSFSLGRGETLGIVGESGCGKTSVAFSIMGLLPPNGKFVDGQILFKGLDIVKLPPDELRKVRWSNISIIFQSAMNALDPVYKIGDLLIEVLRNKKNMNKHEARARVAEIFELVGLPVSRMDHYPYEFSGGMKQRVIIAMSLLLNPDLIIADEPTTALDVITQNQILEEIKNLQKRFDIAMICISHDISIIAEICEKIAVMYGGKISECADTVSIFKNPHHPYTMALLHCFPSIHGPLKKLKSLPGRPPNLQNPPAGCRFEPRCPYAKEVCSKEEPPRMDVSKDHYSFCHFALEPSLRKIRFELGEEDNKKRSID